MSSHKNMSRKVAREVYWDEHDRELYECPDCGRTEGEFPGTFEVHHVRGNPMDNRVENLVGLCRLCHPLREGKKPSIDHIESLREGYRSTDDNYDMDPAIKSYLTQCRVRKWGDPFDVYWDQFGQWIQRELGTNPLSKEDLLEGLIEYEHADVSIHPQGHIEVKGIDPVP